MPLGRARPCLSRFLGAYLGDRCGSQGVLREWSRGAASEFGRSAARRRRSRAATRIRRGDAAATKRLSSIANCAAISAKRRTGCTCAHGPASRTARAIQTRRSPASRPTGSAAAAERGHGTTSAPTGRAAKSAGRPISGSPAPRPRRGAAAGTCGDSFAADLGAEARLGGGNRAGAGLADAQRTSRAGCGRTLSAAGALLARFPTAAQPARRLAA